MKLIAFIIFHLVSRIACQAINFKKYAGNKWQNQVPYVISSEFSSDERQTIEYSIDKWNYNLADCIKFKPRRDESDYVLIISGNGCWSSLGKIGGEQEISLQHNGCLYRTTIWHQFMRSLGFDNEHNRPDRDDYVEVLWENIPDEWKSQYQKLNTNYFVSIGPYDYYSIMHYPIYTFVSGRPAFSIKDPGVDINRVGHADDFSKNDLQRIRQLYC